MCAFVCGLDFDMVPQDRLDGCLPRTCAYYHLLVSAYVISLVKYIIDNLRCAYGSSLLALLVPVVQSVTKELLHMTATTAVRRAPVPNRYLQPPDLPGRPGQLETA